MGILYMEFKKLSLKLNIATMKHIILKPVIILISLLTIKLLAAQRALPTLAPGVTHPVGQNINKETYRLTSCDYTGVRLFAFPNPQSEIQSLKSKEFNTFILSSLTYKNYPYYIPMHLLRLIRQAAIVLAYLLFLTFIYSLKK